MPNIIANGTPVSFEYAGKTRSGVVEKGDHETLLIIRTPGETDPRKAFRSFKRADVTGFTIG
jgi:hypothetical protein